jgi:hypothetical protein
VAKDFTGTRVDSREFTLNVTGPLAVKLSRSTAEVGVPVRSRLTVSGGQAPYTWTATGALPPGVTIGADGVLSGVPTRAGSYTLMARLVDANGVVTDVEVRLVVRPRLAIATTRLPAAVAGRGYRARLAVRGGVGGLRYGIASGALPSKLKLSARTGTIAGLPARAGTYRVTFRVRDALGAVSTKTLVLHVRQ